ncbi:MAG: stage II sporulation protein R [Clostridiales bacterium]|nr:stage II sporulation protein R [Clostridiales bacterium]
MSNQPSVPCLPGKRSRPALRWGVALLLSGLLLTASWAGYRQAALVEGLVRFHVVAASDNEEDQRQKLLVRDAVLDAARPLLAEADSAGDAQTILAAHLEELAQAGADALQASGGSGTVTAALNRRYYSTRYGENAALPAGEYVSLQIIIGAGEGHNWWCILFPDLSAGEDAAAVMVEEDAGLVTQADEGYELRFRCLELWGAFKEWLS